MILSEQATMDDIGNDGSSTSVATFQGSFEVDHGGAAGTASL